MGSKVLKNQKLSGPKRRSMALKSLDKNIPRAGMVVKNFDGEVVGQVTSGTFSPSLKVGIALALVNADIKVRDKLVIDVRGRQGDVEVVKLPFVTSHVR